MNVRKGLHQKYNVSKVNGDPIDEDAVYFVHRLDGDGTYAIASRRAAIVYAYQISNALPDVAADLTDLVDSLSVLHKDLLESVK